MRILRILAISLIILSLILLLSTACQATVKVFGDGETVLWENNSQTFSIAASGTMSESVGYIWPPADATLSGMTLISNSSGVLSWGDHGNLSGLSDDDHSIYWADTTIGNRAVDYNTTGLINLVELGKAATDNYWFGDAQTMGTAGSTLSAASNNIAIGSDAMELAADGDDNIAIGTNALAALAGSVTNGNRNIAIGTDSMLSMSNRSDCIAIGFEAMKLATSGENIAIGSNSGDTLISGGTKNTFVGIRTGRGITTEIENSFFGHGAGGSISGSGNTLVGQDNVI